jgi:hypothetical protein
MRYHQRAIRSDQLRQVDALARHHRPPAPLAEELSQLRLRMQTRRERLADDAIPPLLIPLLRLEEHPYLMHQTPLPLELRFHQAQVNHINANRRVNAFDMRPKIAARFRFKN